MKRILSLLLCSVVLLSFSQAQLIRTSKPFLPKCHSYLGQGKYLIAGAGIDRSRGFNPEYAAGIIWSADKGEEKFIDYSGYGEKRINVLAPLPQGGWIAGCGSMTTGEFLLILDEKAKLKMALRIPFAAAVHCIVPEEDGYVLGGFFDGGMQTLGAIKLSLKGELMWGWKMKDGRGNAIDDFVKEIIPHEGGYFLGYTKSRTMEVAALDPEGGEVWRTPVDEAYSELNDMVLHPDGTLWVTGQGEVNSKDPKPAGGVLVANISPEGEMNWRKNYESKYSSSGEALVIDPDQKVWLLARITDSGIVPALIELDDKGNEANRTKLYQETTQLFGLHQLEDGKFYFFSADNVSSVNPTINRFDF